MNEHGGQPEGVGPTISPQIGAALDTWRSELTDLSARNGLLFFRHQSAGTLDLSDCKAELLSRLAEGSSVDLDDLFDDNARGDAARRSRTIHRKATELAEERGISTCLLAFGSMTWTPSRVTASAAPCAPVLLLPLRMEPKGAARENFSLTADPAELLINPSLVEYLRAEFDTALPFTADDIDMASDGGLDAAAHLIADTGRSLGAIPGFDYDLPVVVGNFAYQKLPMVEDLARLAPAIDAHPVARALAGDATAIAAVAGSAVDITAADLEHFPIENEHLVLSADSTQHVAIRKVLGGSNLVIQGPPGTGKSQTISNLIAALAAEGKTTLFVAEKRAAIDAVIGRLEQVGLAGIVQDLHSKTGTRREVARQLGEALERIGTVTEPDSTALHHELEEKRSELNGFSGVVGHVNEPWKLSLTDTQNMILEAPPAVRGTAGIHPSVLPSLSAEAYRRARESLGELVDLGDARLTREHTPWADYPLDAAVDLAEAVRLVNQIKDWSLPAANETLGELAAATGLTPSPTIGGWRSLIDLIGQVREIESVFEPSRLWTTDIADLRRRLEPAVAGGFRKASAGTFSSDYKRAVDEVDPLLAAGHHMPPEQSCVELDRALALAATWHQASGGATTPRSSPNLELAEEKFLGINADLFTLSEILGISPLADADSTLLGPFIDSLHEHIADTPRIPRIRALRRSLEQLGLGGVVAEVRSEGDDAETARRRLDFAYAMAVRGEIIRLHPDLAAFDAAVHDNKVARFADLDRAHLLTNVARVSRRTAERTIDAMNRHPDQAALIRREAAKKTRHLGLRDLFEQAGDVLIGLRPCWTMSPLSVSQLLPAEAGLFDVVIFDEASQVPPSDAIATLVRGRQAVVAGDRYQLPPTSFFATASDDESDPIDDSSMTGGMESILDALSAVLPASQLSWHYRSRDDRLIAFSNGFIYSNSLLTFPGRDLDGAVTFVEVRQNEPMSSGPTSVEEVEAVVDLILDHARRRPHQTLGVIAPGVNHANAIDEALRLRLGDHPELHAYFEGHHDEPFFVKNLERVQGDERDRIIFTVGYCRGPDGKVPLRFGPINSDGGERRLNVAASRAKEQMTVVAAFTEQDLDPARLTSRGSVFLRDFIAFARSGGSDLGSAGRSHPPLNGFELDVKARLEARGMLLYPQYGASGYRIDFAAADPQDPTNLVLAIEADGASYHSSPAARDRDRLRQEVLESKGWRFCRIWSTDWFADPESAADRVAAIYADAVEESRLDTPARPAPDVTVPPEADQPADAPTREWDTSPVTPGRSSVADYESAELESVIRWIRSDGLLRTDDELIGEAMRYCGFSKRGSRIVAALTDAIAATSGNAHAG